MTGADDWAPSEPERSKKKGSGESIADVCVRLLEHNEFVVDRAGNVFRYNGRFWEPCGEAYLGKLAVDVDGFRNSNINRRREIISMVKVLRMQPGLKWGRLPDHEIAFNNGVLNLVDGTLRDHAPEDYLENVIPWDFVPRARSRLWEECIAEWQGEPGADGKYFLSPQRLELADALQEFFGYVQLSHARYKRGLVLLGESDTGKSVALMVMMAMVGREATCSLSVEHMDDATMRAVIVGKKLNLLTELPVNAVVKDGAFKQLVSTEEPIMINEKNVPAYMYQSSAKHVIATNSLPDITDRSEAVFNRLLIIPFDNVVPRDKQRRGLLELLTSPEHMAGINAWAVIGARRLHARLGVWPEPEVSARLLRRYRDDQNPVIRFLEECFTRSGSIAEPMAGLLGEYNRWRGGKRTDTRSFFKMMRKAAVTVAGEGKPDDYVKRVRAVEKRDGVVVVDALGRKRKGRPTWCLAGWQFEGQVRTDSMVISAEAPDEPGELVAESRLASKIDRDKKEPF
jgi:P4 family phage/plasmid primase-like protien